MIKITENYETPEQFKERQKTLKLVQDWDYKFKQAMVHKAPLTAEWYDYWDAYLGDFYTNSGKPEYKSDQISNFIFSTIETIRPVMIDGDPGFDVKAKTEDGSAVQEKIQVAFDHEFTRENMSIKIPRQTLTSLVIGTAVWYLPWDGEAESDYDGEVRAVEVNPFNIYPDPLATSLDDAEYVIYATYKHVNKLKKMFPDKANLLEGSGIKYEELVANQETPSKVDNQILVLEIYCRDYTTIESEEVKDDGKKYKVKERKYKNGRVLTIAPELELLLEDKENPYDDGKFPFILVKDYDIPFKFWGEGEVKQLLSPQEYINDLSNQIIDNAKLTTNMPWIVDKNSGIGMGTLTNRPGLVIRKNPGTEVRRENPPTMPTYVSDKIETLKSDMESISGVHDVTQGRRPTGIQAGNAIMALQEAGQARIRIKVRLMEESLSKLALMWYSRMQQFWKLDRWVRISGNDGESVFQVVTEDDLKHSFDIDIISGSTMQKNKSGMLDLLIRLAQTTAEDGLPMVDREALLEFTDIKDKERIVRQMSEMAEQQNINEETMQQVDEVSEQAYSGMEELTAVIDEVVDALSQLADEVVEMKQESVQKEEAEQQEQIEQEEAMKEEEMAMREAEIEAREAELDGQMEMPGMDETLDLSMEAPMDSTEEQLEEQVVEVLRIIIEQGWSPDEFIEIANAEGLDPAIIEAVLMILMSEEGEPEAMEEDVDMQGEIPYSLLEEFNQLSEEEIMQIAQERPDIIEFIENNLDK